MYIGNSILDLIMKEITIEYNGTHNSDPKAPLWGRRAYWRISHKNLRGCMKITTKVYSVNPRSETLKKLLRVEIKRRIEAIQECMTLDNYGQMYIQQSDPYSIRPLIEIFERKFLEFEMRKHRIGA